ncbi:MAG: hypothetical protein ACJLS3_01805 [Erythrobacter sp.]
MKILKIAFFSATIALAPAAYAQVVEQPVETEEQAPETTPDTDLTEMPAPETPETDTDTETETEEASPEIPLSDETPSAPEPR